MACLCQKMTQVENIFENVNVDFCRSKYNPVLAENLFYQSGAIRIKMAANGIFNHLF